MATVSGVCKITFLAAVDFAVLYSLFQDAVVAAVPIVVLVLYGLLGGYLGLIKDGAVRIDKLPAYDGARLTMAQELLSSDMQAVTGRGLPKIKWYIAPSETLNATAYGANCVSLNRATLDNTDPVMLAAVMAHEISHIMNLDSEFNRVLFASITALVLSLSILSALSMGFLFLLFLVLCCCSKTIRSWVGLILFQGSSKVLGGLFQILQRVIVYGYKTLNGLLSRSAEYRADRLSASLGYGLPLARFLAMAEAEPQQLVSITDVLYRSHPPTERRIYKLEKESNEQPV